MDFSIFSLTRPMGCVLLDYNDLSTGSCMHEMGHGFGFNDARGEIKPQPGGVYGDPVDVMSYANCRFFAGTNGRTGPGFNAAALWLRGWLPPTDAVVINAPSGIPDREYTLSPLYGSSLVPGSARAVVVDSPRPGRYIDREVFFVEYRANQTGTIDAGLKPACRLRTQRAQHPGRV